MEINKVNPFQAQNMQAISSPKAVGGESFAGITKNSKSSGSNMFAQQTSGINEAMNGQAVNTGSQLGKNPGIAGKKLNLVG